MRDDRLALVTGANQGLGLQITKELAAHGLIVLVGARDLAKGEAAAREVASVRTRSSSTSPIRPRSRPPPSASAASSAGSIS